MYDKYFFEQMFLAQNLRHQKLYKVRKTSLLAYITSVPFPGLEVNFFQPQNEKKAWLAKKLLPYRATTTLRRKWSFYVNVDENSE